MGCYKWGLCTGELHAECEMRIQKTEGTSLISHADLGWSCRQTRAVCVARVSGDANMASASINC